jgi:hypothetical protein
VAVTDPSQSLISCSCSDGEEDARVKWRAANAKALEEKEDVEKKDNNAVNVKAQV